MMNKKNKVKWLKKHSTLQRLTIEARDLPLKRLHYRNYVLISKEAN